MNADGSRSGYVSRDLMAYLSRVNFRESLKSAFMGGELKKLIEKTIDFLSSGLLWRLGRARDRRNTSDD